MMAQANKARPVASPRVVDYVWARDVDVSSLLVDNELIEGVLDRGSLIVLYADSNAGKTFLAFDMGAHVASGRCWRDRAVKPGLVVYIAGEGVRGALLRVEAMRRRDVLGPEAPFVVVKRAVNFRDPADLGALRNTLEWVTAAAGADVHLELVIIDTLARSIPGASENEGEVMGAFVAACDTIRTETGAAVMVIHHTGKDPTRGARGHGSLRAAADTEIHVEPTPAGRVATVTKQRDGESGIQFAFDLELVVVGHNHRGAPVTSCIVKHLDETPAPKIKAAGRNQTAALAAIVEWARQHPSEHEIGGDDLRELLDAQGLGGRSGKYRRRDAVKYLVDVGVLVASVHGHTVNRVAL